jgi:type II secretory pathway pseudopilin PulG
MQFTNRWFSRRLRMPALALPLALAAGLSGASATAQESKSTAAARDLAAILDAAKLDSIAAPDPTSPGTWVAALYFKDAQLLVVSAQYIAPVLLEEKAKSKQFRDIYIDLNSASVAGTKVFVQDMSANGLIFDPDNDGAADTWEEKNKIFAFDGDWRKAKLSEDQYQKTFSDADARYARMLALLTAEAKPKSGS